MGIDEEIEALESIKSDLESAISEAENTYFEDRIASWEDDIRDINERLYELEQQQGSVWAAELREQNIQFEGSRL